MIMADPHRDRRPMLVGTRSTIWTGVAMLLVGILAVLPMTNAVTTWDFTYTISPGDNFLDGKLKGFDFYAEVLAIGEGTGIVHGNMGADNPGGPPPTGITPLGKFLTIEYVLDGLTITGMTIRIYYTDQEVAAVGIDPQTLQIYLWSGGSWGSLPTTTGSDQYGKYLQIVIAVPTSEYGPMGQGRSGGPVGGVVVPVNKLALVSPWVAVVGLVACIGTIVVVAKKRHQ